MRSLALTNHFSGLAVKRVSAVEADAGRSSSNQHEFNGVLGFQRMLGPCGEPRRYSAKMLYFSDDEEKHASEESVVTWYDARLNHPTRSECRLYYPHCQAMEEAVEGDLLFIVQRNNESLLLIVCQSESTVANQLLWLFNIEGTSLQQKFQFREDLSDRDPGYAGRIILEELEIEVDERDENRLDEMLEKFDRSFPTTEVFSAYARETLPEVKPIDDPDQALVDWMLQEEMLFRTLEKYFVEERLQTGFKDIDSFVQYSLSIQNRRKSRVGYALEHHLAEIFDRHRISYERGAKTEGKKKPDFLFPDGKSYHDPDYPVSQLSMLGVKSTCKDRWRQVLSEADRIDRKHLLTMEPGISVSQTAEMKASQLQLVIPRELLQTYRNSQVDWLITLRDFILHLKGHL
jgi:hypothetical protein